MLGVPGRRNNTRQSILRGIGANWEHTALARLSQGFESPILHQIQRGSRNLLRSKTGDGCASQNSSTKLWAPSLIGKASLLQCERSGSTPGLSTKFLGCLQQLLFSLRETKKYILLNSLGLWYNQEHTVLTSRSRRSVTARTYQIHMPGWRNGYALGCNPCYAGSTPVPGSKHKYHHAFLYWW